MSDDLDTLLAKLTPEERARLAARLARGTGEGDENDSAPLAATPPAAERHEPTSSQDTAPPGAGSVHVDGHARINGVVVGVNLGRIIYGRDPEEDERRRLVWYLDRLAARLVRLPLRGLADQFDKGKGLGLPQVYIAAATTQREVVVEGSAEKIALYGTVEETHHIGSGASIVGSRFTVHEAYDPDWALPQVAICDGGLVGDDRWVFYRAVLATAAIHNHQRLVLLGDPGSGKSTFVRHLAWALAQRGLDQLGDTTALVGWNDQRRLLPILVPLRRLAGRLAAGDEPQIAVFDALRAEMQTYNVGPVDDLINDVLHRGKALLLFDGLDEVPLEGAAGSASRSATLAAIATWQRQYPRIWAVLTCRTRAFDEELRALLGWPVETLAPFTLGQIRHFVPAWYNELVDSGHLTDEQATRMGESIIEAVLTSPKLRAMAENPLLLTLMALVRMKGELPRDRPQLYERFLELLLGQWDEVRDGQSMGQMLGLPDWGSERIRPLLDRLSYEAHAAASSEDGRGRVQRSVLRDDLCEFFTEAKVDQPWEKARRCLDYFEQRSGLLAADERQSYVFAHLTLQEHCAGRHMLRSREAPALVLQHRGDDRWREPILLGLGVVQEYNAALIDRILGDLIDRDEGGQPKPVERWYRDLIFAAEIGIDRDWNYLRVQQVNVERLQRDLRRGLVALLADKSQPLPVAERVRAGFLLGGVGDPRYPVTVEQWRHEIERAFAGDTGGYFCRVEAGSYIIGSSDDDPDAKDDEKPQHTVTFDAPFFVARYPITNDQWQTWVEAGGEVSLYAPDAALNRPNQPVVGVNWHMVNQFCAWVSEQVNATVRLPSEYEWEAAARGGDARCYLWGNEWQDDRAATEEDQETRRSTWSVPVGCYPAGVAPCGALDMAGNVWEWVADEYRSYPGAEKPFTEPYRVIRGSGYVSGRTDVRCAARLGYPPVYGGNVVGFRVLVSPRLAQ